MGCGASAGPGAGVRPQSSPADGGSASSSSAAPKEEPVKHDESDANKVHGFRSENGTDSSRHGGCQPQTCTRISTEPIDVLSIPSVLRDRRKQATVVGDLRIDLGHKMSGTPRSSGQCKTLPNILERGPIKEMEPESVDGDEVPPIESDDEEAPKACLNVQKSVFLGEMDFRARGDRRNSTRWRTDSNLPAVGNTNTDSALTMPRRVATEENFGSVRTVSRNFRTLVDLGDGAAAASRKALSRCTSLTDAPKDIEQEEVQPFSGCSSAASSFAPQGAADAAGSTLAADVDNSLSELPVLLARQLSPSSKNRPQENRRGNGVIIFDWDDTLFPTFWMCSNKPALHWNKPCPDEPRFKDPFSRLAEGLRALLETACGLASVAIVTLAKDPWVSKCLENFIPDVEETIVKNQVNVFYASKTVHHRLLDTPDPDEPLQRWYEHHTILKRVAMRQALRKLGYKRRGSNREEGPHHVISVGDSTIERDALQDLQSFWWNSDKPFCAKTVKLMEDPDIECHIKQVNALRTLLQRLHAYEGDCDIELKDMDLELWSTDLELRSTNFVPQSSASRLLGMSSPDCSYSALELRQYDPTPTGTQEVRQLSKVDEGDPS